MAFSGFSTPEQNPALEVLSTPAHPQVTGTFRLTSTFCHNFGGLRMDLSLGAGIVGSFTYLYPERVDAFVMVSVGRFTDEGNYLEEGGGVVGYLPGACLIVVK